MANKNLTAAKKAKNDEFYTQYHDIEKEINAYIDFNPDVFRDKTILLPCDDPEWSNFTKFFSQNFERFGLKKLISTSYAADSKLYKTSYQVSMFEESAPHYDAKKTKKHGKIFTLDHDISGDGKIDVNDLEWSYLKGDGDFNSAEVGGRKVIIENQLEKTDHDHLGKLITYASGLEAEIIIWIVKDVLEEHRQAIDWLNEHTDENINFFAIRMELWKIGESLAAPKFHIISKPNDWSKAVKQSIQKAEFTDTKLLQQEFWDGFKSYAQEKNWKLRLRKTYPQHWYDLSFGRSDCHIALTINSQKNELGCEIYIPNSPETYQIFKDHKLEIDSIIDGLDWMDLPTKKASRIKKVVSGDLSKTEIWNEYFQWLGEWALKLQEVFTKY
ncbi:DUF4268 domain-containing protein [Algoriphagus halophilus]|uniref:DUF4268 domain-containing protein n=1 Tax=Algoriphagus halophilus TaxID=226505 RepID=A0A1N6D3M0_9BACT|nr:DUF4268 domain-containing protein [Algoriphagus halophilus]SIN65430.1 protein of unknown function [Algoriphagus halophilus]